MKKIIVLFKKHKYIYSAALLLLIIGGYYWQSKNSQSAEEVQYKTATAEKGTLTLAVSGSGNIVVDQSANVDPTITGTVYGLAVSVGDQVKKGQLLFMIENDQLGIDAAKSYSSYLQSTASLETAKANKKDAKNNYDDASSSDKKSLKNKLEAAKISLEVAEKNVQTSWSTYQNSLVDAGKRKVVSPIDGTVNAINMKNGDDLGRLSSSSSSQAPIVLGDLNTLKVQIEVNEVDITNVSVGQKSTLTFDAVPDFTATGKVEKIDSLGTINSGVVTYNVTIGFDNLDPRLKSEMSALANIIINVKPDVLLVPNSAIKTQNSSSYVEVLSSGSTPVNTPVEIGEANDTSTEIISGLNVGDKVVTQTITAGASATAASAASRSSSLRLPGLGGGR